LARLRTLLLRPDLRNSRHPARERRNLQVEANASHDFGPDISVRTPSLTDLCIVELSSILSVVSMQPLPRLEDDPEDLWFVAEKSGLDDVELTGYVDPIDNPNV